MRLRSLNSRLTFAAIAAVLLAVLVLGIGAQIIIGNRLQSSLDSSLRKRAVEVARLSISAPAVLDAPGALESPVSGRQLSVEVLDRRGTILARSLALGAKLLPRGPEVAAAFSGRSGFADAELGSESLRVFAAPIADAGGSAAGGVVMVASSTADIEATRHELGLLLLLCGAAAVLAGGLAAALLTRRSTAPLRELSTSAAEIARTGDAARRLETRRDPSEIGELAETLNAMLAALEESRQAERRFLADASHEMRTPLTSLIGNVDFLARHGASEELIADLQGDASRLRRLIDDLLELERASGAPAPRQEVRLDRVVAEISAEKQVVAAVVDGPVTVLGDSDALARSIENLLENAAVHGPSGDRVEGFAPGEEEAAFGRFWRAEDARGRPGSGIGLAIVKATAERHGGSVYARGSTVTISLPLAEPSSS
ncbi:MAG TPA: HAMP domain-containing sensor histidine kinase [Solirubrobacterales bacterium]|nr:HAMP domain-containing sensor histidine kinase [Solirubrobacterales bacterium]